jgi:ribonuclease T2
MVQRDPAVGRRRLGLVAALAAGIALLAGPATASGVAGRFDFYVLALSWSPGYCATDRHPDARQCAMSGLGFVVHGLWPQYEHGYPDFCEADGRRISARTIDSIADLMPSPGLARYEWKKHGQCSGLTPTAYFDLMRAARNKVRIPQRFRSRAMVQHVSPDELEGAFVAANPGLGKAGRAIACRRGSLTEVRICLDKGLGFRTCREVDSDTCGSRTISVPPMH